MLCILGLHNGICCNQMRVVFVEPCSCSEISEDQKPFQGFFGIVYKDSQPKKWLTGC